MKYCTFEELPVWQASVEFASRVFAFTEKNDFRGLGDTKNQLERSSLSVSNNIAEGFERGTTAELINFLYIAKGSAGESRSMLRICEPLPRFSDLKFEISDLIGRAINISKQLNGWIESLKNTDIKGPKFLTQKERDRFAHEREFAEFDAEMDRYRRELQERLERRSRGE